MTETKTLENGIRVVVKRMEGLLSVTMGVLVGTGAAYETDAEDGLSHFIEHMQFKGTAARTAFELNDAFDEIGAQVNAFTAKDVTCYYTKATTDHAKEAFALLSDLFLNSVFPEEEMKREKGVVIEEINMDEDSPEDLCLDGLSRALFGRENYGRNILGPAENVRRFTREDILSYRKERYVPENIVLSFAGNISFVEAFALAEQSFGTLGRTPFSDREKKVSFRTDRLFKKKPIEQAHFAIGFPSVPRASADCSAIQVMNAVLGGGMSSRLFRSVREERGLAYSVYSYPSHYAEAGILSIYAGVNPKKAREAADAVVSVVKTLVREGVSEEEFRRGREQVRSGNIYAQENTSAQMLLYGKHMLYHNEVYDFGQRMELIAALTREDIMKVIGESFDFSRAAVSTVGNLERGIEL